MIRDILQLLKLKKPTETVQHRREQTGRFRMISAHTIPSYYRARYYDPSAGRFLREDPVRFAGGQNFYSYVTNNPVNRKDPLGLWQLTIGGGLGLGGMLTFGNNSGQFNFGLYTGGGEGLFTKLDMSDSGGCHKFGAHGGVRADTEVGFGPGVTVDINVEEGSDPEVGVMVAKPNVIGVSVNPAEPHQLPHIVLPFGAGGFAGLGFSFHSPPSQCGCSGE
jgi:RHS repeat-associated protein